MPIDPHLASPSDRANALLDALARPLGRQLNWLWGRGFRFLIVIDAVVLFSTMVLITLVRFGGDWPTYPTSHYVAGFSIATVIHLTVNYFSGLYEREPPLGTRPWLPRVSLAMGIGVALDGLAAVLLDRYLMPRLNLAILAVGGAMVLSLTRHFTRRLAHQRRGPSRLVLVGSMLERDRARPYLIAATAAGAVATETESINEVAKLVARDRCSDVLLLDLKAFADGFPEPLTALDQLGVGVHQRVSAAETLLGLSAVREIGGIPFTRLRFQPLAPHQLRLKRIFDLVVVIGATPVWLPTVAVLALYSRAVAGPGVLFRQARVGQSGETFSLVKFRTMVHDAERVSGPTFATPNDPRLVRKLRWMRRTRLDELPQLFNVLTGKMSLVGPRPERPVFVERLQEEIPSYAKRHQVPPGITGLAQLRGRYDTDPAHKLGYDLQYLVNWSVGLDLQILISSAFSIRWLGRAQ